MKKEGGDLQKQADHLQKAIDRFCQQQNEQINQPMEALRKLRRRWPAAESKFVQLVARQKAVVDALDRFRQDEQVRDEPIARRLSSCARRKRRFDVSLAN